MKNVMQYLAYGKYLQFFSVADVSFKNLLHHYVYLYYEVHLSQQGQDSLIVKPIHAQKIL